MKIKILSIVAVLGSIHDVTASLPGGRYIVKYRTRRGENLARNDAVEVYQELPRQSALAGEYTEEVLDALSRDPLIEYIEEDGIVYAEEYLRGGSGREDHRQLAQSTPYGIGMVEADQVTNIPQCNKDKKICIIDSGYDVSHEDLPSTDITGEPVSGSFPWDVDACSHGKSYCLNS